MKRATKPNIWPFSSRAASSSSREWKPRGKASVYQGVRITPTNFGTYATSIEPESEFDSPKEAKEFIKAWKRNPAKALAALKNPGKSKRFERCVKSVKARGGAADPEAVCAASLRKTGWTPKRRKNALPIGIGLTDVDKYAKRFVAKTTAGLKKKRRNPADAASEAFQDFSGRESEEFLTVKQKIHHHGFLAAAGELRMLKVRTVDGRAVVKISGFDHAVLAFNESRNQLFIQGGDQAVNLADFGIEEPHEVETLGKVIAIDYFADKEHLGAEGGRAVYRHKFRTVNENGQHVTVRVARYPDLIYYVLDERLVFSGGSYEILPEGINR